MKVSVCGGAGNGLLTIMDTVELGVVIGRGGANIKISNAQSHVAGYCIALDMTARDLQVRT